MAELPYTAIAVQAAAGTTDFAIPEGAGEVFADPRFEDEPETGAGRIAVLVIAGGGAGQAPQVGDGTDSAPTDGGPQTTQTVDGTAAGAAQTVLVVEQGDWSVACPLTSGQLHRLTNALAGRGTRSGIRPESTRGGHVYLSGSPELLEIEDGDHTVHVPAGPKRGLSKALRAIEQELAA